MEQVTDYCPECGSERTDFDTTCDACGAPPRSDDTSGAIVRNTDLEPYVALRYIARLFKILAVLLILMMFGEVAVGLTTHGTGAVPDLLSEVTRLLVLAGLLWGAGDIAVLLIDLGHDVRVSRILLGRINARMHIPGAADALSTLSTSTTTRPSQGGEVRSEARSEPRT